MTVNAPSDREEFQGFSAFYEEEIAPYLRAREDARQEAVMHVGLIAIVAAVVVFAIYHFAPFGPGSLQAALFAGVAAIAIAGWRLNRTRAAIAGGSIALISSGCGSCRPLIASAGKMRCAGKGAAPTLSSAKRI